MKVLVTGGAGFIGSNIVDALVKRGEDVTVLDNFLTGFRKNLQPLWKDIRVVKGDVRNPRDVKKAVGKNRIVIHQAAIRSVPKSVDDPCLSHNVNATGTLLLLEEARRAGVQRFVYASSSSVYGDVAKFPQTEKDALLPLSPYGVSKLAGENYCYTYYSNFGLETVALRYFNVYGPRQNPESKYSAVVPAFLDMIRKGKSPVIDGDGRQSRDFTYVGDVVRANLAGAFGPKRCAGHAYNIGGGNEVSVLGVLQELVRATGKSVKPKFGPSRKGDARRTVGDLSKARRLLAWMASITFREGRQETVEWFDAAR